MLEFNKDTWLSNLHRIQSQVFSLLPIREEGKDWIKPLETLVIELLGISKFYPDSAELCSLVCKMRGLLEMPDIDFLSFRRSIFEYCNLLNKIMTAVEGE